MSLHWLTRYDLDDDPYGQTCDCGIGADHDDYLVDYEAAAAADAPAATAETPTT